MQSGEAGDKSLLDKQLRNASARSAAFTGNGGQRRIGSRDAGDDGSGAGQGIVPGVAGAATRSTADTFVS